MKDLLIRSVLFSAVIALFIAASSINTNSNSLGDNNSVPPSNIVRYVTPHGAGDHSGSSWSNAYTFSEMKSKLTSNTTTTEKPLVQVKDCIIIGGKGIGITQDDHPRVGNFSSKIENSKIGSLDPSKPTCRLDWAVALTSSTTAWIKNNTFYSPDGYGPDCPVLEYNTDSTAVLYQNNNWIKGGDLFDFCVTHNAQ